MADNKDGTTFLIPRNRRLTWDLLWFNSAVPLCGHDRMMDLSRLAEARSKAAVRISWPAIFLKAYALVAKEVPELRRIWYRWPFAHMYQHPNSVGILTVQREHKGMPWLSWERISEPENKSLLEVQAEIDHYTNAHPRKAFRNEIRLASLPMLLRRLIWGWNIHVAKNGRANRIGTFFLSTLSGRNVEIQVPPSVQTGCFTYGPLSDRGFSRLTLAYDHRVMDGAQVAAIFDLLEMTLLETLTRELLQVESPDDMIHDAA